MALSQMQTMKLSFPSQIPMTNTFHKIGVPLLKRPEKSEYGTFVWIADPDDRWIELWEK